jgi:hypothetical protein
MALHVSSGESRIVSADDYFMNGPDLSSYKFDASKLQQAHADCFSKFIGFMEQGIPNIFVDNTNVRKMDRDRYANEADRNGYQVVEIHLEVGVKEAHARCIHGVSESTINRMNMEMHR